MLSDASDAVQFTGCDLHYNRDTPAFARNPSTTEPATPRPVSVNGKRMPVIDMHAHCQLSNVWPMVEGREELEGKNPYEGQLKKVENIDVRLQQMDAMGTDVEVLSIGTCLLYTSPSPRDATLSRMPSSA